MTTPLSTKDRVAWMGGLTGRPGPRGMQLRTVICALIGHSRIDTVFMWYHYCSRCHAQIGDSLGGIFESFANYYHLKRGDCEICEGKRKDLTWKDWLLVWDYEDEAEKSEP